MATQLLVPATNLIPAVSNEWRGSGFQVKRLIRVTQIHCKTGNTVTGMQLARTATLKGTVSALLVNLLNGGINDTTLFSGGHRYDIDVVLQPGFYAYNFRTSSGHYHGVPSVNTDYFTMADSSTNWQSPSTGYTVGGTTAGSNGFEPALGLVFFDVKKSHQMMM
jgi:hypothetical protein